MPHFESLPLIIQWIFALTGFIFGFYFLMRSADCFVDGAVQLARRFQVPPLIIGFTIVGFGTSTPELIVSLLATLQGAPILALGNVYGSNITNILFILGACMLVAPLTLHRQLLRRDLPFLLFVSLLILLFSYGEGNGLTRGEGLTLLLSFIALSWWQFKTLPPPSSEDSLPHASPPPLPLHPLRRALLQTFGGLLALIAVSQILVLSSIWLAEHIATWVGVTEATTELIISVTIIALGTSLPELMASISATRKGEDDIAVGNIVGSNCFNLCVVAGLALFITPLEGTQIPDAFRTRDLYMMLLATILLFGFGYFKAWRLPKTSSQTSPRLGRSIGILFVTLWIIYTCGVVLTTRA